ncbi:hypothetical protein SAMN05444487_104149 [Marininema mesophilum]|uniref:Uncharacterized protein n=1 Tax=Marininema mesophilum TaxID=1048340 RepID=A0A1H2UNG5_9BACL|nr:hypothetical protein [Marininema mesophilum]SDW57119.1 hypothetical protein SAMN05444487_104149 [Marininema mesophilum]
MSSVLFDCSQFVSFNTNDSNVVDDLKNDLKELSFEKIKDEKEIDNVKMKYYQHEWRKYVLEMIDLEFLGYLEADEWPKQNEVPIPIVGLITVLKKYVDMKLIRDLKIIFVGYAPEKKNDKLIARVRVTSDNIIDELFENQFETVIILEVENT